MYIYYVYKATTVISVVPSFFMYRIAWGENLMQKFIFIIGSHLDDDALFHTEMGEYIFVFAPFLYLFFFLLLYVFFVVQL